MSNAAITWAWQQKVPPGEKLVLVALADYAHPDTNICWPGQNSIAKMTGQGELPQITHQTPDAIHSYLLAELDCFGVTKNANWVNKHQCW